MTIDPRQLDEIVQKNVRPATYPVGVKLAAAGDAEPDKARRPVRDLGNPIAVCQGMTIARTIGWTMVFTPEDHGCPVGSVVAGHSPAGKFLNGEVASLYQDDPEAGRTMEGSYPRLAEGEAAGIWISPLSRCAFEPDLAVIYGTPAQMVVLLHAANFGRGEGVRSVSSGRVGCSAWIAGVVSSGECTYMIPGSGERVFGGTQDHEMSFIIPSSRFDEVARGLEKMRRKGSYRYPVPNMHLMAKPNMPEIYRKLTEG